MYINRHACLYLYIYICICICVHIKMNIYMQRTIGDVKEDGEFFRKPLVAYHDSESDTDDDHMDDDEMDLEEDVALL